MACKLPYKENCGSPSEFPNYYRPTGLEMCLERYSDTRFGNALRNAASLFLLAAAVHCVQTSNRLHSALKSDLEIPAIMAGCRCFGLLSVMLCEPYLVGVRAANALAAARSVCRRVVENLTVFMRVE